MMTDRLLDHLIGEMKERMTMLSEALAAGRAASFDEYRYTCGQIRGLESACAVITDLKKRMETSDDE